MKNLFRLLFVATLLLASLDLTARNSFSYRGLSYIINNDGATATLVMSGSHISDTVVVPDNVAYNGKTFVVTALGRDAFHGCMKLLEVRLPGTVKRIGDSAFCQCVELKRVVAAEPLQHIGKRCFLGCAVLCEKPAVSANAEVAEDAFRDTPFEEKGFK